MECRNKEFLAWAKNSFTALLQSNRIKSKKYYSKTMKKILIIIIVIFSININAMTKDIKPIGPTHIRFYTVNLSVIGYIVWI